MYKGRTTPASSVGWVLGVSEQLAFTYGSSLLGKEIQIFKVPLG